VNRQETAVEVANYEVDTLGWGPDRALLAAPSAPNDDFSPDALVAGPLGGLVEAPILIVEGPDTLGDAAEGFINDHSNTITEVDLIGGTAVLSDEVFQAAETAAQDTEGDQADNDLTGAPELQSVVINNFTSTGGSLSAGQLLLTFTFDEDVLATPIVQNGFKIYDAYGETVFSKSAQLSSTDAHDVKVVFDVGDANGGTSAFALNEGTVLTVVAGTVQDSDGKTNPEGDLPGSISQSFAAGTTRNPDLTSVVATSGATAETSFDYTFDLGVTAPVAASFKVVDTDGGVRQASSATVVSGTTPANTVVRATFTASTTGTAVRGAALNGAVSWTSLTSIKNPTQAADIANGGISDSPDLVSVTIDDANDRVTFVFDETLDSPVVRTGFHVYYRTSNTGANFATSTVASDLSSSDLRTVVAQFPVGAINEFVAGAYVDDSAVDRAGSAAVPNRVDEEGVASSFSGGDYLGPELESAAVTNTTNVFGTVTGRQVTFTWDQVVTLTDATKFFVTDAEGNRTNLTGCVLGSGTGTAPTTSTTVTCVATGTTSTVSTEIGDAELATVASGAVTGTTVRSTQSGTSSNLIANHEERAAAPGTARG